MHPVRQFILFRWILYVAVAVGIGAFLLTRHPAAPKFTSDVAKRLAPKQVQKPDPVVVKTLGSAVAVLKGERVPFGGVDQVEPSLISLHQDVTATGQKKMSVNISAVFLGPPKKYTILNGALYEVGDKLADGRTIKDIQADGIVLGVGEVEELIEWLPSFRVELKKAEVKKGAAVDAGKAAEAQAVPAQTAPAVTQTNIPENPTPEQALNILQQLKKQQAQKK